jgi:glycogen debranching enzyme
MMPADNGQKESPFYIVDSGPASRPRRTLKQGDTFIILDSYGEMGVAPGGPDGLFHADTRYLSRLALTLDGRQLLLLGSTILHDNAGAVTDLTNPDIVVDGRITMPKDTIHLSRFLFLWDEMVHERFAIHNHGTDTARFVLALGFRSDFADIFEVRGLKRPARGRILEPEISSTGIGLAYDGLDGLRRTTEIAVSPEPFTLERAQICYAVELPPGGRWTAFLTIGCDKTRAPSAKAFLGSLRLARRSHSRLRRSSARLATSSPIMGQVIDRSVADLAMLLTETPEGLFPYAGIPWFSTSFGRDSIIIAIELLWMDPGIARAVLTRLAAYQARDKDSASDAEPGKILHEMRGGEMARLGEVPFGRYYGSVDSTPLFVLLAGRYFQRTGDIETLRRLWPHILAALGWIDGSGDRDGDGFVEYHRATDKGLINQGWKDSYDAIFHADGTLAEGPIALVEVQAYVYAAKRSIARAAEMLGEHAHAASLRREAQALAERFDEAFWCEAIGCYAIALDGEKRQCRVVSSNAGHALFGGIARADRAALTADRLMQPDSFSGWGIRTVASGAARYNPMSYHNGSVWPHDNALITLGFAQYRFHAHVQRVVEAVLAAAMEMELYRLPELYCGFRRSRGRGPTLYPVACAPQGWAAAAPLAFLHACLGLRFLPELEEIQLHSPILPKRIERLEIHGLRMGQGAIDLLIHGSGADLAMAVPARQGQIRAMMIQEP